MPSDGDGNAVGQALITESAHLLLDVFLPRISKCLSHLSETEIWHRPNAETVSIGNLVLHLCGNVRQWIIAGLGGATDTRKRSEEFSEAGPIPTKELVSRLEGTLDEAKGVLDRLDPTTLLHPIQVQDYDATGVIILAHVVEHFSYHTGEITYAVKARKAVDLGYYADRDLDVV